MIESKEFKRYLDLAYHAYQESNVTNQAYRQDGNVPYMTHPLGSALLLLADTDLPREMRELGFKILVLHDVLEDTSITLPDWIPEEVRKGVEDMTYEEGPLEEKFKKVRAKSDFIQLLSLYDAGWTFYEKHIREPERRKLWKEGVRILTDEAEKNYGRIRIVQIMRACLENTDW